MTNGDEKALSTEDLARTDERRTAQAAPPPDQPAAEVPQTAAAGSAAGRQEVESGGGTRALAEQQKQVEAGAGSVAPPAETHLISVDAATGYRARWTEIQAAFVDEPRQTLEHADGLVAEVIQLLTRSFADERGKLEAQWTSGEQVSTEEMRLAFQRYRTFFNALLR